MKSYNNYEFEDFLSDEDFQQWVRTGSPVEVEVWQRLVDNFPEKEFAFEKAREFILSWQHQSSFSAAEVEQGIQRILATKTAQQRLLAQEVNSPWRGWQIAAATVILIGISWSFWLALQSDKPYTYAVLTTQSPVALTEIINNSSTNKQIDLPDGSCVTLTPSSRISYAFNMAKVSSRKVFLTGEACFEVTKDPRKPFLVYADGLITRVVGTSFTIRTGQKQVFVQVRTGRVALYPMQASNPSAKLKEAVVLTPNQQATFLPENNQFTRTIVNKPLALLHEHQPVSFTFDNTPVEEVFARLEQVYGLSIQFDKAVLKNCKLTVPLSDEPFFTKLDIICQTIGASYNVTDTQISISSKGCD